LHDLARLHAIHDHHDHDIRRTRQGRRGGMHHGPARGQRRHGEGVDVTHRHRPAAVKQPLRHGATHVAHTDEADALLRHQASSA
jgi:hypothetical protein